MEYAIFPMKKMSISQAYSTSHKAWDCNGDGKGKDYWYAPCRIKVLALFPRKTTGFYNTVLFGTCDENRNEAAVMCEDGVARVLTFGCTHIDTEDYDNFSYEVNHVYEAGEPCYREGFEGLSSDNDLHGNHVHMDVGLGWQYKKEKIDGGWHLNDTMLSDTKTLIGNTFYKLEGFNDDSDVNTKGYTFTTVTSRTVSGSGTVEPTPTPTPTPDTTEKISITGYGLYVNKLGLKIRTEPNSSSESLITVPVGKELKIRKFLDGFQSDGYQWAATEYDGNVGYSQIDTNGYYTVVLTDTSVISPSNGACIVPRTLYLIASSKGANIRASIPSGKATFVSAGSKIKVEELIPGFQSDGYQWVKASYNGTTGYVQADVKNWHYFKID